MPQKKKIENAVGEDSGLRLSTIIRQEKIDPNIATAVMRAHGLTSRDRMAAGRIKSMIDRWLKAPVGGK